MFVRCTSVFGAVLALAAQVPALAQAPLPSGPPPVLEITAEDYAFRAPDQVQAGWSTVRFDNQGEEHHFVVFLRLPEGKTFDDYMIRVGDPFNQIWHQLRDGHIGPADRAPAAGRSTFQVKFAEHPGDVPLTNALHLARIDDHGDIERIVAWTNWLLVEGLQDPAPADLVGGLQPKPTGEYGFFTVDLAPGTYLLVAEAAGQAGAHRTVTVTASPTAAQTADDRAHSTEITIP